MEHLCRDCLVRGSHCLGCSLAHLRLERESELGQSDGLHALQDLQVDEDPQFQNTHTGDRKADLLLVDSQLEAKGLKKVENGEPDLYVGYSITLGQPKKQTAAAPVADSSMADREFLECA